ncbi:MAG: transcription repressor NadR [Lachnospiraceae bacterium]|nr:transcription repressor NadR [Lachnospiraceae bacterium]
MQFRKGDDMNATERRKEIVNLIQTSDEPLSGSKLSKNLHVSRQVIVQDIALLKASGYDILATSRGYMLKERTACTRALKVHHTNDEIEDELTTIVDLGGTIVDVFVWHRVYGKIEAKMNVASRRHVAQFIEGIRSGRSTPLMNITSGYHYHTIMADCEETLDLIEQALSDKNYLAPEI